MLIYIYSRALIAMLIYISIIVGGILIWIISS